MSRSATESPPDTLPTSREHPLHPPALLGLFRETEPVGRLAYPEGTIGWLVTSHELARHPDDPGQAGPEKLAVAW
jgi:hypothetical protein